MRLALICLTAAIAFAQPPRRSPMSIPVDLAVPFAPMPFTGGGKTHLAYELHITNFSPNELHLKRIGILGEHDQPLASFEGDALKEIVARPGAPGSAEPLTLGPGLRAVAYLWVTLEENAAIPAALHHSLTIDDKTMEAAEVRVSTAKPPVIGPPLAGSDWFAANGPGNASPHRRALIPVGGSARIAQRFAIDWVQVLPNGETFTGDEKDNKSYRAYGSNVLAVADAVVATVKDGIPQNIPGEDSRAVPITLETVGGNHIILDLGNGFFAFYAHLQPGSMRVKAGDRVRRGQVLALLGNSGNSTEPHLHFHVSNANSPLGSEGVPYVLDSFEVLKPGAGLRHRELPMQEETVRFGKP
jgi:murein DD-endopeptidase MepM/ murein hydrolase activator NlpD